MPTWAQGMMGFGARRLPKNDLAAMRFGFRQFAQFAQRTRQVKLGIHTIRFALQGLVKTGNGLFEAALGLKDCAQVVVKVR